MISVPRHATATDCDRLLSCWSEEDEAIVYFCAIHTEDYAHGSYNEYVCWEAGGWSAHPVMIKTTAKQTLLKNIHDELFDGRVTCTFLHFFRVQKTDQCVLFGDVTSCAATH